MTTSDHLSDLWTHDHFTPAELKLSKLYLVLLLEQFGGAFQGLLKCLGCITTTRSAHNRHRSSSAPWLGLQGISAHTGNFDPVCAGIRRNSDSWCL